MLSQGALSVSVQRARDPFVSPEDPAFPAGVTSGLVFFETEGFDLVVVKNGYQFPSQVERAARSFRALTLGGTDLDFTRLPIHRWERPMFSLDRDTEADLTPVLLSSIQ